MLNLLKNKIDSYRGTELEKKVKEVTSTDQWHAPNSVKDEIAQATFDYHGYREVMDVVWKRLEQPADMYVVIVKTLSLLEYLIRAGSQRVIEEIRNHIYQVKSLQNFKFTDETGRDRGAGARETAKRICELLLDEDMLKQVRDEAEANRDKYVAMSNSGGVGNSRYGGQGSSMGSGMGSGSRYGGIGSESASRYGGGGAGSKYDGYSGGGASADSFGSTSSASASWKQDREPARNSKPAAKPAAKKPVVPANVEFADDGFVSAASGSSKAAAAAAAAAAAVSAQDDFDFDADFDQVASAKSAPTPADAAPAAASFDAFDAFSAIGSAPAAAPVPAPQQHDPFAFSAPVPTPAPAQAQAQHDPFSAFSAHAPAPTPVPAPAAADPFDMFSAPAPAPAPSQASASAASPTSFDDFGDFSSAAPAAPATTASKIDAKVKSDSLWGLADLDLTEEKPASRTQVGSAQHMFSAQPQGDAFAGLMGANNAPAPTLRPMGQPQQGMGMMPVNMGFPQQQYGGMPQQQYGGMQQQQNNYW